MGTPRPRRATSADTAAIAALSPAIIPTESHDRAVFVIDGETGPIAAIDLAKWPTTSTSTISSAARASAAGCSPMPPPQRARWASPSCAGRASPAAAGVSATGRCNAPATISTISACRVWHDGTASLPQTLYFRGTWAAVALLIGFGSISAAVFLGDDVTLAHIVIPALLCALATIFAIFQIGLLTIAARRVAGRGAFAATSAAAAAALLAIGALLIDRAAPTLVEMWAIYTGDAELNQLAVRVSADGSTLYVEGSYGMGGEETVRRALDQNPGIRTVVLAGPGGRISVGSELYEMFRDRKLATRVDDECASACTIAFLGGVDRSISPGGRLGFHRGSFPGLSDNDMYESNRDFRRFLLYRPSSRPQFVDRVFATPPDDIWEPTPQELLAGRVINRVNH